MVLDAVGLQQPLRYTVDLKEGLVQQPMSSQLMKGDKKANRVIVKITNGSETVDLSGVGVSGSFIRPPDEAELTLAGNANGNEVVIVLDDLCYAEEGYCKIDVKLTASDVSRTILALTGYVLAKGNGAYIDVGNVIPNIDDIIAQYSEMKAVTERTLAAAQRAEALAIDASGYAANTGMLGGQPPSYYATAERANQLSEQIASYVQFQFPDITIPKGNGYIDVPFLSNQLTFLNEQRALNKRPIVGFCSSFSNDGIMVQVHSPMVASSVTSLRFKYCNPNDADTTTQLRVVLIIADACPIINS